MIEHSPTHPLAASKLFFNFLIFHISTFRSALVSPSWDAMVQYVSLIRRQTSHVKTQWLLQKWRLSKKSRVKRSHRFLSKSTFGCFTIPIKVSSYDVLVFILNVCVEIEYHWPFISKNNAFQQNCATPRLSTTTCENHLTSSRGQSVSCLRRRLWLAGNYQPK